MGFPRRTFIACAVVALLLAGGYAQQANIDVLRIGNSGSLVVTGGNENEALKSLQSFIKDETGFNNEIIRQKDWQELLQKMRQKDLHLGVFQGYEFAWAQEKDPQLKPLALALNVYVYPVVYVVVRNDTSIADFNGLQGQTLALPATGQAHLRLYVAKLTHENGKKPEQFFAKITSPEN